MTQTEAEILMYATTWCPDCARSKRLLDKHNVKYTWINIEEVPEAADTVRHLNKGMQVVPTIVLPGGKVLAEPSDKELSAALGLN
ncbi:MAG: NrdH-redoxin [Chloroflexi bacterium]|nr:NrdH-redoxin [Chloroflexota bacterium]